MPLSDVSQIAEFGAPRENSGAHPVRAEGQGRLSDEDDSRGYVSINLELISLGQVTDGIKRAFLAPNFLN